MSSIAPPDLSAARSAFRLPAGTSYLNTASHAPRLERVHAAALASLDSTLAPWAQSMEAWAAQIERIRQLAANLLDGDADGIALVPSAGYGLSTAAHNLPLARGDAVLVLEGQFPSNLLPWQALCERTGGRMVAAQRDADGDFDDGILACLARDPRIRIVALPNVHWHDGTQIDLDRIAPAVHAAGAALVLDLSQSLGALPADLAAWRPDFVASVGYKWLLGSSGLAYLWAAPKWREAGRPIEFNWVASSRRDSFVYPMAASPPPGRGSRRFDAGGVSDPVRLAIAEAALGQVDAWGPAWISAQLQHLTDALDTGLAAAGCAAWCTPGHAPHIAGVRPPAERLDTIATALAASGIIVTRRSGVLRVAPHLCADVAMMQRAVAVMAAAA